MSLSKFASQVATVEAKASKKPTTPKPWTVYQVIHGQCIAAGMDEKASKAKAEEEAIEGYFGPIESITDLQGLLLGLGIMVAEAPKNEKGYIAGLNAFRRPYKAMFSMALNGTLPDAEDFSLLLTWADVLHASDASLRAIVDDVRAAVNKSPEKSIELYKAQLDKAKAAYKASRTAATMAHARELDGQL